MFTTKYIGSHRARILPWVVLLLGTSCASPQTLQPLAQENRTNITNYGANVHAVALAVRKQVELLAALQIQRARKSVIFELVKIRQTILPSKPTDSQLADTTKEWYKDLKKTVDILAAKLETVSRDDREAVADSLMREHPASIDIALGTPGFSVPRVLRDSLTLDETNKSIVKERNEAVRRALMEKRNAIVAPYRAVVQEVEFDQVYLAALDYYLAVLKEQATIAVTHADAILAFSEAKPAFSSVKETFQHEELRSSLLTYVEKRNGKEFAKRLNERLSQFDETFKILEGLRAR